MNRFLTAAAALLLARLVVSQTTFATITGLLTDPNGGAVPNATITVTNTETNYRYSARSNETRSDLSKAPTLCAPRPLVSRLTKSATSVW